MSRAVSLDVSLRKRLGGFVLDAAFTVPIGVTALFGPSGSGKTQTLRCIAGLARPDAGRVAVAGRVLFDSDRGIDVPTRERQIGYVFQQYALFPHLDVAGNLAYGLHREPREKRAARVAELLDLVGLPGFERRRPRELSGGQQQRVAFARALATQPRLLLLDEPFAALDPEIRAQLRADLDDLRRRLDLPVVLVTHDRADVYALADRVAVYSAGRVLQVGSRDEVFRRPATAEVARLTGTPNLLPAEVIRRGPEGLVIRCGDQDLLTGPADLAPGERVLAAVRPEVIQIVREDRPVSAPVERNQLAGEIVQRLAQGLTYRLRFRPDRSVGVPKLIIDLPSLAFDRLQLTAHQRRIVAIAPDAIHLIPASAAPASASPEAGSSPPALQPPGASLPSEVS